MVYDSITPKQEPLLLLLLCLSPFYSVNNFEVAILLGSDGLQFLSVLDLSGDFAVAGNNVLTFNLLAIWLWYI